MVQSRIGVYVGKTRFQVSCDRQEWHLYYYRMVFWIFNILLIILLYYLIYQDTYNKTLHSSVELPFPSVHPYLIGLNEKKNTSNGFKA